MDQRKSAAVFFAQVFVLFIVIISSLINLSLAWQTNKLFWASLLCISIGYMLPNPTLKSSRREEEEIELQLRH